MGVFKKEASVFNGTIPVNERYFRDIVPYLFVIECLL